MWKSGSGAGSRYLPTLGAARPFVGRSTGPHWSPPVPSRARVVVEVVEVVLEAEAEEEAVQWQAMEAQEEHKQDVAALRQHLDFRVQMLPELQVEVLGE